MAVPISNVTRRAVYAPSGAGGAGPYAFTFEILANTDIAVYKDDTLLTLTTHYTVTINANGTGSVTITATGLALAPLSPTQYAIVGNRTISRSTDFTTGGDFFANTLNDELDQQTIFAQQNSEGLQRALSAPQTDPTTIDMILPRSSERASKVLAFDSSGNPTATEFIGSNRGNWATATLYYVRDIVKDTSTSNIFQVTVEHTSVGAQPLTTNAEAAKYFLLVDAAAAGASATAAAASASAAASSASGASTSATNASNSATTATTQASNASTSASSASTSATAAAASAAAAAASFDAFDDIYLGAKATDPTVDNDGNALTTGDQYFNTTANELRVYNGSTWQAASTVGGTVTSLTVTGVASFADGTAAAPSITNDGDTNTGIFFPAADTIAFTEGGAEAMRINSSGNVGIGTSSPATILNAYNATSAIISVDGDTTAIVRPTRYSTDASSPQFLARKARGTLASPTAVVTSDNAGGMYIQAYGGTNFRTIARIDGFVDTYTSDTNIAGSLRFYTNTSSTDVTEKMRIDSSGNVGIGTTSPAALLDVDKSQNSTTSIRVGNTNAGSSANSRLIAVADAGNIQVKAMSSTNTTYGAADCGVINCDTMAGGLRFSHNDVVAMTLDASGNLLVGDTTYRLSGIAAAGQAIQLGSRTFIGSNASGDTSLGGLSGSNFTAIYSNGAEKMRIDSSGNVGIGTSSPASKLNVSGTFTITGAGMQLDNNQAVSGKNTSGTSRQIMVIDGSNNLVLGGTVDGGILFNTSAGNERAKLDTVGNLQMEGGAFMPYAPAPAAISAATTLTNANIQGQIISATGTTYTITMPLGSTMETLATWATTNIGYDFYVVNTASGIITMAVNTGVTALGSLTVAIAASAHFRIRRTAANTFVLYRLS